MTTPPLPVSIGPVRVPQDAVSRATWGWAHRRLPRYLLAHSIRSYCWGATLGADEGLAFDEEVLWSAALMHDVGLSRLTRNGRCFEFEGAAIARRFLAQAGMPVEDAGRAGRAIELHMAPSVGPEDGVEAFLLDRATGIDVRGAEFASIARTRGSVIEILPRGDFDRRFLAAMRHEVTLRPGCESERLVVVRDLAGGMARSPWRQEAAAAQPI